MSKYTDTPVWFSWEQDGHLVAIVYRGKPGKDWPLTQEETVLGLIKDFGEPVKRGKIKGAKAGEYLLSWYKPDIPLHWVQWVDFCVQQDREEDEGGD